MSFPTTSTGPPSTFAADLLSGKVVVLTGSSGAFGTRTFEVLEAAGASVVGFDITSGPHARAIDVTDETAVADAMSSIEADLGSIDVLVNNAGVYAESPVSATDLDEWNHVLGVNLTGAFICAKHAVPALQRSGSGSIVNVASQVAFTGAPGAAAYGVSKAGLVGLTRSLARELAPTVRVNTVAPGPVPTSLINEWATDDAWVAAKTDTLALGRMGTVEEIADSIVFLASDASSYVTGQTIHVNGGGHLG